MKNGKHIDGKISSRGKKGSSKIAPVAKSNVTRGAERRETLSLSDGAGMEPSERIEEVVKIVIPSYKRAGRVTTLGKIWGASLCVSESEESEYREHYPNTEIIVHPDSIKGYSPKAQWLLERYPNLFLCDDDFMGMIRKYPGSVKEYPTVVEPDIAYSLVQNTAYVAREMGAYLFGFSSIPNPKTYVGLQPYRFKGFIIGGACGYLEGGGLHFDCSFTAASDFWMALYNAWRNRYCFVDERFAFVDDPKTPTFGTRGGVAEYRSIETERLDFERLHAYFGDCVKKKEVPTSSIRKLKNPYEKTIYLPF